MGEYPKVFVLSNECFSDISSNGRTLRNFFVGWPRECLAQFYIHGSFPDVNVCGRYYCVSDGMALRAFIKRKSVYGKLMLAPKQNVQSGYSGHKIRRNAVSMLLREVVWSSMRWAGKDFYKWIEEFSPELILLQAGDSAFMFRLARKLARKYEIPLVIYNSEAYYFKNFDYFRAKGLAKLIYPLFRRIFCREFEKTIKSASSSIYCCDKLKQDYDSCFGLPSQVIYTSAHPSNAKPINQSSPLQISYLGNLGLERYKGLIEIADVLQRISPQIKLNVYGKLPGEHVERAFSKCEGIVYHGFISYEKVQEVIAQSHILVHAESFEDFYKEDLKYAFSTKIADSLASGRCFLLYAPEELACTEYLRQQDAAWVVDNKEELLTVLKLLTEDSGARDRYVDRAIVLAEKNHNIEKNVEKFQQILRACIIEEKS